MELSAALAKDAYKIGHIHQYPEHTSRVYSNFTARSGKHANVKGVDGVVFVGLQLFICDYLIDEWNHTFFYLPKAVAVGKYKRIVDALLGTDVDVSHIGELHDLGHLPVEIRALPEGTLVPYNVPLFTVDSTNPKFAWVTNVIESVLSAEMWLPITSATTYFAYRRIFNRYAVETGGDLGFVPFQGHDFSFRGMAGRHAAAISGFAHLAAGSCGTDTLPALEVAEKFYGADVEKELIGMSVNATEHSVMCAGSKDDEYETYRRLVEDVYPSGIVSIVSDTWNLWDVIVNILPRLRNKILQRDGKVVIRPDSGDPVKILCGDPDAPEHTPERDGVILLLWNIFGGTKTDKGYRVFDPHIGAIYGDSITLERADEILRRLKENKFASTNVVLGIGSYTYQFVTRDTHGMAMKATYVEIDGNGREIFKDPITDDGGKKSAKGLLKVDCEDGRLVLKDQVSNDDALSGQLEVVFRNGTLKKYQRFSDIRARVLGSL